MRSPLVFLGVGGVVLFFAGRATVSAEQPVASQMAELRVLVEGLRQENARLKAELEQRESVIRQLGQSLAVARTESELFQDKWSEAQLRAQTLGLNPGDADLVRVQRQLVEGVRALYLLEAQREQLGKHLRGLLAALDGRGDLDQEIQRARELLAAEESRRAVPGSSGRGGTKPTAPKLDAARVIEVNASLRLAVLNVGASHGVRVGMPLAVVRSDRVVGELRVVEVRNRICGALIERLEQGITLRAGDQAHVTKS